MCLKVLEQGQHRDVIIKQGQVGEPLWSQSLNN